MDLDSLQTKWELDKLIADFKRLNTVFRFVSLAVYILFIVYRLAVGQGYLALNVFLLVITVAYAAFAAVCAVREARGANIKKGDKIASKIYHRAKLVALFVSAVLSVFGIFTAADHTTALSVALAIALPVLLVIQILFDIAVYCVTQRVRRFQSALSRDMDVLKRDMVKIAVGLLKDSLFHRNKEGGRQLEEDEPPVRGGAENEGNEEDGIIVVGSDEPVSVKAMKSMGAPPEKKNPVARFFARVFGRRGEKHPGDKMPGEKKERRQSPPALPAGETRTENE